MGRVTIERDAPAAGRDADIRTYPVKAGETIQAGDVVDVVGGSVGSTWRENPNVKSVFVSSPVSAIACAVLKNGAVVLFGGSNSGGGSLYYRTGRITGDTIQWGAYANFANNYAGLACCALSADKVVVAHTNGVNQLAIPVFTVDPDTLSIKKVAEATTKPSNYNSLVALSDTKVSLITELEGVRLTVFDVSGSVINSVATSNLPGVTSSSYISATRLPDSGSNKRVCVCYRDAGDGNKGKAVIATVSASNVVTWGTPVVFDAEVSTNLSCSGSGEDAVVSYIAGSILKAAILSVSGSTITALAHITIGPGAADATSTVETGDSIAISYVKSYSPASAEAVVLTRSGNTLRAGTPYMFNQARANYLSGAPAVDGRILLCYQDAGNNNYGTATLLEVRGDQIAGGFDDVSSQAIALQGGTEGQRIDVIFDGTAELPGITAGTSIASPGVQGYSPQDGWLWVKPEWEKDTRISTGGYIGTGTSGSAAPNILTFDFEPYIVFIMGGGGNSAPGVAMLMRPFDGAVDGRNDYHGAGGRGYCFFKGKEVSWYASDGKTQMNLSYGNGNYPYRYVAIG